MEDVPSIRDFAADEWATYRTLRLQSLTESPDAFGSTLEAEGQSDDSDWQKRLSAGVLSARDLPVVAEYRGQPIGLAWGRLEGADADVAHLYQMWVAPRSRRLGAGRMLLEHVITWAKALEVRHIELSVAHGNTAAARLYLGAGFEWTDPIEPIGMSSKLPMRTMKLDTKGDAA